MATRGDVSRRNSSSSSSGGGTVVHRRRVDDHVPAGRRYSSPWSVRRRYGAVVVCYARVVRRHLDRQSPLTVVGCHHQTQLRHVQTDGQPQNIMPQSFFSVPPL